MREGETDAGAFCPPSSPPASAGNRGLMPPLPPRPSPGRARPARPARPAQPQRGVPSSVLERPRGADAGKTGGLGGAFLVAREITAPVFQETDCSRPGFGCPSSYTGVRPSGAAVPLREQGSRLRAAPVLGVSPGPRPSSSCPGRGLPLGASLQLGIQVRLRPAGPRRPSL